MSSPPEADGPVDGDLPPQPYDLGALRPQLHAAATNARRSCASLPAGETVVVFRDGHGKEGVMLFVSLAVARDGRVDVTHVTRALGAPDDRSPLGECVRTAFGGAHVPPWSGARDAPLDWDVLVWFPRH